MNSSAFIEQETWSNGQRVANFISWVASTLRANLSPVRVYGSRDRECMDLFFFSCLCSKISVNFSSSTTLYESLHKVETLILERREYILAMICQSLRCNSMRVSLLCIWWNVATGNLGRKIHVIKAGSCIALYKFISLINYSTYYTSTSSIPKYKSL